MTNTKYICEWRFNDPGATTNPATFSAFMATSTQSAAEKMARQFAKRNGWRFVQCYPANECPLELHPSAPVTQ